MKQITFSKVLTVVACALMLYMLVPTFGAADQAQYIYDDLGRLAKVIDGQGNVVTEAGSVGRIRVEVGR